MKYCKKWMPTERSPGSTWSTLCDCALAHCMALQCACSPLCCVPLVPHSIFHERGLQSSEAHGRLPFYLAVRQSAQPPSILHFIPILGVRAGLGLSRVPTPSRLFTNENRQMGVFVHLSFRSVTPVTRNLGTLLL